MGDIGSRDEIVPEFTKVPPIPGGHGDVWRCDQPFCGALVRGLPGKMEHHLAFHVPADDVEALRELFSEIWSHGFMRGLLDRGHTSNPFDVEQPEPLYEPDALEQQRIDALELKQQIFEEKEAGHAQ